jgi:hypothetical protein
MVYPQHSCPGSRVSAKNRVRGSLDSGDRAPPGSADFGGRARILRPSYRHVGSELHDFGSGAPLGLRRVFPVMPVNAPMCPGWPSSDMTPEAALQVTFSTFLVNEKGSKMAAVECYAAQATRWRREWLLARELWLE